MNEKHFSDLNMCDLKTRKRDFWDRQTKFDSHYNQFTANQWKNPFYFEV